jgi:hypothetical protein
LGNASIEELEIVFGEARDWFSVLVLYNDAHLNHARAYAKRRRLSGRVS